MGTFVHKGQGPNEFFSVSPIYQIIAEGDELKTLLFAPNEKKLFKWNISQSISQRKTVIDTIIPYSCSEGNLRGCYDYIFQHEDVLYVHIPSIALSEKEGSLPFYQKRNLYTDSTITDYPIYRESIKNDDASIIPEAFFNSVTAYKPDGSRIVQFMKRLKQFNILDTETGKVTGYRMEGSPDFSVFKKKKTGIHTYYIRVQANDQFIYASYWGSGDWERFDIPTINTIHVFDWNGNWLYELKTDMPVHEMWLDRVRNRLYTTNLDVDEVFFIDLNEIN